MLYSAMPDERPITSVCVVEDASKCPANFTIVARSHDHDTDADLYKDGFFSKRVTRYLCHSKTEGYLGYVVEQLLVVPDRESTPPGFTTLTSTMDTSQKAFKKRQICFKALSKNMAKQIITDIIVLSNSRAAPEGFTLAGEINGMLLCYKVGPPLSGTPTSPSSHLPNLPYQMGPGARSGSIPSLYPGLERPGRPAPAPPYTPPAGHRPPMPVGGTANDDTYEATTAALFGVPFQLNKKYCDLGVDTSDKDDILQQFTAKTSHQIENQYHYAFSLEQDVVQRPTVTT